MKTMMMLMAGLCVTVGAQERLGPSNQCDDRLMFHPLHTVCSDPELGIPDPLVTFTTLDAKEGPYRKGDRFTVAIWMGEFDRRTCLQLGLQATLIWDWDLIELVDCVEVNDCVTFYTCGCNTRNPACADREWFTFVATIPYGENCLDKGCDIYYLTFEVIGDVKTFAPVESCIGMHPDFDPQAGGWPPNRMVDCYTINPINWRVEEFEFTVTGW
jgi:hypothetical protein